MNTFRFTLCNEVLAALPFERQCALAAALGYDGLEIAPFTLSDNPASLTTNERANLAKIAEVEGIVITGLHWLLNVPDGLSLTSDDADTHRRTGDHMAAMVDLCADLGGKVIVHGSPKQRSLSDAATPERARNSALSLLREAGERAGAAGVTYCIEPLSPAMTGFVTSVREALDIVDEIGEPALNTMIDTLAAWGGEIEPPDVLIRRHMGTGRIRHIHLNDDNMRAPGQGERRFAPILQALIDTGYAGFIGVEPFECYPDGATAAARAIGYLRGIAETLEPLS
ncbi:MULTISPECIES: sugar phosphate isomerase/epimerase family protein [Pseudorhizobium]|uniref:Sugar phosphate isomerase/epimerase n=1 Tax=Pseudorhizobium halotolerans TaxID=1233081 RepID=A0ABN7JYG0_9HYPH|nr:MULTISPECIES: sugar phosphate isomerase/epimerase family protein [Pseudorhizobium]CAD7054140.1 sugar phosphate isomerase/epimerase [Pseudorhizobium halotolerans]